MADGKLKSCAHCGKTFALIANIQTFCSVECRFWAKVAKGGHDDCWLWRGSKAAFGHGRFTYRHPGSRTRFVYAHRMSWEMANGPLVAKHDVCVLHKCDVPACVNPSHLFIGTRADNVADMVAKGRDRHEHKARLTISDIRAIRASSETQSSLARRYGVAQAHISAIIRRENWKNVE